MSEKTTKPDSLKQILEIGPIFVFVIVYFYLRRTQPDTAIYPAAIIFTILAVIALLISRARSGRWSGMLIFTTGVIVLTTGAAWLFKDPRFLYMKPTVINAVFGGLVIGGVFAKKNVIKMMMGDAFELPLKAWNTLAIRWGVFFFAMAGLNELVWRNFEEPTWIKFKLLGFVPLTLVFAVSQVPFMMKYGTMKGVSEDPAE
jgi:intracellular septation protein